MPVNCPPGILTISVPVTYLGEKHLKSFDEIAKYKLYSTMDR